MATLVTLEQREDIRSIALARADSTKQSRLSPLASTFGSMTPDSLVMFDDSDLALWSDDLPVIVHNVTDGATLDDSARKMLNGFRQAAVRELRKATNDSADLRGSFYEDEGEDGITRTTYGVVRTK